MDIIKVTGIIFLVANGMLPITTLPDTPLVFSLATSGNTFAFLDAVRKSRFDLPPAQAEIVISLRQLPHRMKMIG